MNKQLVYRSLIHSGFVLIAILLIGLIVPKNAYAVNCTVPISGNVAISSSCSFPYTVDGVDTGTGTNPNIATLTINSGATLTISANQTIATGSLLPGNGTIIVLGGGQIQLGLPIWMVDADGDGYPANTTQIIQTTTPTNGVRRNSLTSITEADGNDGSSCTTNGASAGTCKVCLNGAASNIAAGGDTYGDCGAIDCDGGVTKYYNGWSSNVCYYKTDVSAANATCDGAGACKTTAVQCAASTQGVSSGVTRTACKTQVGCTGTTIGSLGNVTSGQDTSSDCAASLNACSGTTPIGPDGNCNGSGACNTTGNSGTACATAGACQSGGGCSAGSCVSVVANDNSNPTYPAGTYYDGSAVCTGGACQQGQRYYTVNTCTPAYGLAWTNLAANTGCSPTYPAGTYYDGAPVQYSTCQSGYRYYTANTCTVGAGLGWTSIANVAAGQDTYGDCNLGAATIISNFGTGQTCSTLCNIYSNTSDTCNGSGSCTKSRSCLSIGTSYLTANDGLIIANAGCSSYAGYNCGSVMANQSPNVCYGATTWWTYCLCQ